MLPALGLAALAGGGSLLSSIGAMNASKSQERRQAANNLVAERKNEMAIYLGNEARANLGRELMTIPEHESVHTINSFDAPGFLAGAELAGLNPAYFASVGGLSFYGSQQVIRNTYGHNAADAYKLMVPEVQQFSPNIANNNGSMMGAIGGAITAGASAFGTQYRADQSYDLQMSKMLLASDQMGMGMSSQNGYQTAIMSGGLGGRIAGRASAAMAGGLSAGIPGGAAKKGKDDDVYWPGYEQASPMLWEAKKPESTNPIDPSWGWKIPAGFANAEAYEDAFGEAVSIPYGLWKMGNTLLYNTYGKTVPEVFRAAKEEVAEIKASGTLGFSGTVQPYIPAGMPRSLAYPAWATP